MQAGVATSLDHKQRRTFAITPVFKENSIPIFLLPSGLDFLYLWNQNLHQTAKYFASSTLNASKSIMSRYNNFELYSSNLFTTKTLTCIITPSIYQMAQRSLPMTTHDKQAAHNITDELKQYGLIKEDFKLL